MNASKFIKITGIGSLLSYTSYRTVSKQLFKTSFCRKDLSNEAEQKYLDWISSIDLKQINLSSFDGLKLNAYDLHFNDEYPYLIMVHGIWNSKAFMYPRAYEFARLGYNCLLIDQRASGDSEGKYYTYGVKESQDLQLWIDYLTQTYHDTKIALYGVSMGAATVMMTTAYELPENVRCIVEDCGYSSMEEEFDHYIRKYLKLAVTSPVIAMVNKRMNDKMGMTMADASPKQVLENNVLPILFIHGEDDDFVPFEMAKILYNHNKNSIRKFYPVKNAEHTEAVRDPNYYKNVDKFIRDNL